ncbi:MAG: hypothetical protein KAH84_00500 [Thiomargarita sp.]|nr:hypothetical protein [Thiomargarita sp.]
MKYSALTWVKSTIDESLKQTRQALEQFVEYPSDTAPLQQCVNWLHEIYGTLKLLELQTAALLVQEIELTIKSLIAGKIENNETTYDILMRALIQLPNYLDHLAIVQRDIPLALITLLNNLRQLRSLKPLGQNQFFVPDLFVTIPQHKPINLPENKLKKHVLQMRSAYQKGLVAVIKKPKQPTEGLKFIYNVMQRLQQVTGNAPISRVWWVAEGIIESLLQKGLVLNKSIIVGLKQLDVLMVQIVKKGKIAINTPPPKPLLTSLLYFVAISRSKGKQTIAIKKVFQLNDYLPDKNTLITAKLMLTGPDIELMKIVVTLLKDDFARVEETLDIFNRADNPAVTELNPLIERLKSISNTLEIIGLNTQKQTIAKQTSIIVAIIKGKTPPQIQLLYKIANGLLKTYNAVDILGVQGVHAKQRLQQKSDTEFYETPQFDLILGIVVSEAKLELAQVIQPLVSFIDSNAPDDELLEVPKRLKRIQGCLAITSHKRAATMIESCSKYINQVFIKEATIPPEAKRKALADVLIGIELYLDTLAGNPMDTTEILDATQKHLSVLYH